MTAAIEAAECGKNVVLVEKNPSLGAPQAKRPERKAVTGGEVLFRERCSACHTLERVYLEVEKTKGRAPAWLHIVKRMQEKTPRWITPDDMRRHLDPGCCSNGDSRIIHRPRSTKPAIESAAQPTCTILSVARSMAGSRCGAPRQPGFRSTRGRRYMGA